MAKAMTKALNMGALQEIAEQAARNYRTAQTVLQRAIEQSNKAESAYNVAQKALSAGVEQLRASTKVA